MSPDFSPERSQRVDLWLWTARIFKTRSAATTACRGGHVRVNDQPAKPATPARCGDTVRTRGYDIPPIVAVSRVIEAGVKPAPLPRNCSSAGPKSLVDSPCRYSSGSTSETRVDLRAHAGRIADENLLC